MMKKLLMPLSVGILIIISTFSFNSAIGLDLEDEINVNYSSPNLDLLLTGEGIISLIKDDIMQSRDKFVITDSVMDSEGNTYITGNLRDAGIVLDALPRVNLNDDLSRSNERSSPIIAKLDSNGAWNWIYYPVPEKGDECDGESTLEINESYAYANSLSLSSDESKLSFVGAFSGCYDFDSSDFIYNEDPILNGYVANLNASSGDLDWVLSIQHEETSVSFGSIYLSSVGHSNKETNSKIYIAGTVQSLTINPTNSAAGSINLVRGDDSGDAYVAVISAQGELLFQADSCSNNDQEGGSNCNSAGTERGVSVDVYGDSVMIGVEVDTSATNVQIFGSNNVTNVPNKINPLVWEMSATSYTSTSSSTIDLNGASIRDDHIIDSIIVDGELTYLVEQKITEGGYLPLRVVNIDEGTTKTIFAGDSTPSFIPRGFVHGNILGTHILGSWTGASPVTLSWSEEGSNNGTLNLTRGDFLINIDDFSAVVTVNLPFNSNSKYIIANNHHSETSIFAANIQGSHSIGNVYSHDTDGDGIPDQMDPYALTPADQDTDLDSILNVNDNCPNHWNLQQVDFDDDGQGDACDSDADEDGVPNNVPIDFLGLDGCPFENASGFDIDNDGCIDPQNNTIPDSDGDGVIDSADNCVGDNRLDADNDGVPDACDNFPQDWDDDGVDDGNDVCQGYSDGDDLDDDGIPLGCDDYPNDTDNDGIKNPNDNCVFVQNSAQANLDGDSEGDACDEDIDGDGIQNTVPLEMNSSNQDKCPYVYVNIQNDTDQDGCDDEVEPIECPACSETTTDNNSTSADSDIIDPNDIVTAAVIGGTGVVGGGLLTLVAGKVRRVMRYVGVDDGLEVLKHLPRRKKKDGGSDHYFKKGVTRQREMTLSADKDLDDYIEDEN